MEVVEVIKLIAEVGFLVVAAGIFVFLSFRNAIRQQDWMKKQQEWLEDFVKGKVFQEHPTIEESNALDIVNNKIYQEMRGVLNALHADRSYIFLYHNGGISTSGLSFQRMSCICEVVSRGILPMSSQNQQLYRSSYSLLCDSLKEKDFVPVVDSNKLRGTDEFLYQELLGRHSAASYFKAIKDINGNVIGFIGIDYCSIDEVVEFENISKLMKVVSTKISSLVDIRDEVK